MPLFQAVCGPDERILGLYDMKSAGTDTNFTFLYLENKFITCSFCTAEGKKSTMQWAEMDDLLSIALIRFQTFIPSLTCGSHQFRP